MIRRALTFLIISATFLISCSKYFVKSEIQDSFTQIMQETSNNRTAFLFFTDPHINEDNIQFREYLGNIKKYYEALPLEFCLSGGDWLNNNDTCSEAIEKLTFINAITQDYFGPKFYSLLANHDTNYQGLPDGDDEGQTAELSHDQLVDLLFKKVGNTYYSIKNEYSVFYVLDSGIDWDVKMSPFRWEQCHWLANELLTNEEENIVIAMHIFTNNRKDPTELSHNVMRISEAHKNRESILLDGTEYDFSKSKGRVACVLCGHCHKDFTINDYSIPVVGTTHLRAGNTPTYDLIVFDWERGLMNMIRVGYGEDRIFEI